MAGMRPTKRGIGRPLPPVAHAEAQEPKTSALRCSDRPPMREQRPGDTDDLPNLRFARPTATRESSATHCRTSAGALVGSLPRSPVACPPCQFPNPISRSAQPPGMQNGEEPTVPATEPAKDTLKPPVVLLRPVLVPAARNGLCARCSRWVAGGLGPDQRTFFCGLRKTKMCT